MMPNPTFMVLLTRKRTIMEHAIVLVTSTDKLWAQKDAESKVLCMDELWVTDKDTATIPVISHIQEL